MSVEVVNVVLVGLGVLISLVGYMELSRRASNKDLKKDLKEELESWGTGLKEEIGNVDTKVDGFRTELKEDIGKLDKKVDALRTELKEDIGKVDKKVDALRTEVRRDIAALSGQLAVTNQNVYELNTRVSAALGLPAPQPAQSSG